MPGIKQQLYLWSIAYYIITLVLPYVAIKHECGETYDHWLYYTYGAYLVLCGFWEIY